MTTERTVYENPPEFTDDEKWLKIFSAKSAIVFVAGCVITILLFRFFNLFGVGEVGLCIGIPMVIVSTLLTAIPIPTESYLKGGGQTLDVLLAKRYIRRKCKKIYVRGYEK